MEYDSKNILQFLHIDGSSHDIYQRFLDFFFFFFDYLGKLIASVPLCVFSGRGAKSVNGY